VFACGLLSPGTLSAVSDEVQVRSRFRDDLERSNFAEKLTRFETLAGSDVSAADVLNKSSSPQRSHLYNRPKSAPHEKQGPYGGLRHVVSHGTSGAPARKGRSGRSFLETPIGDLDLSDADKATLGYASASGESTLEAFDDVDWIKTLASSSTTATPESKCSSNDESDAGIVSADSLSSSGSQSDDLSRCRTVSSSASDTSQLLVFSTTQSVACSSASTSNAKSRRRRRDGLSDVKAAILASAAAKLASDANRIYVTRTPNGGCDVVSSSYSAGKAELDGGSGSSSVRVEPVREHVDEQSSLCAASASSNNELDLDSDATQESEPQSTRSVSSELPSSTVAVANDRSLNCSKPPTGRTSVDQNRNGRSAERRSLDTATSFLRTLLNKPPTGLGQNHSVRRSSNPTIISCAAEAGSTSVDHRRKSLSTTPDWQTTAARSAGGLPDSKCDRLDLSLVGSAVVAATSVLLTCARNQAVDQKNVVEDTQSFGVLSRPSPNVVDSKPVPESAAAPDADALLDLGTFRGEKLFTRDTVTTNVVLPNVGKRVPAYPASEQPVVSISNGDATGEVQVSSVRQCESSPSAASSSFDGSVQSSPDRNRRSKKSVTFAPDESGRSLSPHQQHRRSRMEAATAAENARTYLEVVDTTSMKNGLNGDNKSHLNNGHATNHDDLSAPNDVANSDERAAGSKTIPSANASSGSTDGVARTQNGATVENGRHELSSETTDDAPLVVDDEDTLSIDLEIDDLSSSQRDLRLLYRQRRAERMQEQEAAEREKRRLEEILKLYAEFGLDATDAVAVSPPGSESAASSSPSDKSERRNSLGRIKTNGSLTKLSGATETTTTTAAAAVTATSPPSATERALGVAGGLNLNSNSDDDVDRGTIKRRPAAAPPSPLVRSVYTTSAGLSRRDVGSSPALAGHLTARIGAGDCIMSDAIVNRGGSLPRTRKLTSEDVTSSRKTVMADVEYERTTPIGATREFFVGGDSDMRLHFERNSEPQSDWYAAGAPDFNPQWTPTGTWKSHQHKVRADTVAFLFLFFQISDALFLDSWILEYYGAVRVTTL
jgi:hypothetical protein